MMRFQGHRLQSFKEIDHIWFSEIWKFFMDELGSDCQQKNNNSKLKKKKNWFILS